MGIRSHLPGLAALAMLSTYAATAPAACTISYSVTNDWGSGFVANVSIANDGPAPINGWTLVWSFPGSQQITNVWSATVQQAGSQVTTTNEDWNGAIAVGNTVGLGFEATYGGGNGAPTDFVLNGTHCSVDVTVPPTNTPGVATPTPTALAPSGPLPPSGVSWPTRFFAPFVDATGYPAFPLADTAADEGLRFFVLGFIVDDGSGCHPSWGTYYPIGEFLKPEIAQLRTLDADVMVSFGGASNTELAVACTNVTTLADRYQAVIDAYGLTHIDFDIEGAWVAQRSSIDRRSQAIALLQQSARAAGRDLNVWLTLPVLPSGLTNDGLYVVDSALTHGVELAGVNIMAMDYGDNAAPAPAGLMAEYATQAANSLAAQLRMLYDAHSLPRTDAELMKMVGVTPMIGLNDVVSERFDLTDADQLVDFALANDIGMLAMWSANRDKQCPGGTTNYVDISCSSVLQAPFEFSHIFNQFTGIVSEPTPTPEVRRCPNAPAVECSAATQARLRLKDDASPTRDKLDWRWVGDGALPDAGDPTTDTSYQLCLYDHRAGTPTLVGEWNVAAGGNCGTRACWRVSASSLRYRNRSGNQDGVVAVSFMNGAGALKIRLQARGAAASLPASYDATRYMSQDPRVVAQLTSLDGQCWKGEFTTAARDDAAIFDARVVRRP